MSAAENKGKSVSNGVNTSEVESETNDETGIASTLKKRKLPEDSAAEEHKQLQVIDDEDDLVMLDGEIDGFKKRRLS